MKLSALHGNSLRVYLALIEERNAQEVCPLSHRALSATIRLSRNTVLQALRHLEQQGLILRKEDGWRPATRPLVGLLAPEGGSEGEPSALEGGSEDEPPVLQSDERGSGIEPPASEDEPLAHGEGSEDEPPASENEPPRPRNGSGIEPLPPGGVQKVNPPADPPTRTRTLWSSSSEEDRGRGGCGGRNPRREDEGDKESFGPRRKKPRRGGGGERDKEFSKSRGRKQPGGGGEKDASS